MFFIKKGRKKEENSHKACMDTLSCGYSSPIYTYWEYEIFTKKPHNYVCVDEIILDGQLKHTSSFHDNFQAH